LEKNGITLFGEKMLNIIKNSKKILILFFFIIIFLIIQTPIITAQDYYAKLEITIDKSGFVDIDGLSNYPGLITEDTQMYTYKNQDLWLLNITKEGNFSDFIYYITFPRYTKIKYIKATGFDGIEEESGRLIISGSGSNEKLSIYIKYEIGNINSKEEKSIYNIILEFFITCIFFLATFLVYFLYKDKKSKSFNDNKSEFNFKGLNKRQKNIVNLLVKSKRALTQKEIQKELGLPKASVSRNIHSLEVKGIVEIEKSGMSNLIRLKKP